MISSVQALNWQYKELYASELAYVNEVYRNKGKKVKDIATVNSDIKDALGDWTIVEVSENGGSVKVGFEAIVLKNPDPSKKN